MSAWRTDRGEATYRQVLQHRYGLGSDGPLGDFVSLRDGRLMLGDQVDLLTLAEQAGAPLEVAYCPLIARQVRRMQAWAAEARRRCGYRGGFVYAYATKANHTAAAVRTALGAGAHYETSSAADVWIAHHLWRAGALDEERFIFCNGSKDRAYSEAVLALRAAGYARVVPILDDPAELEAYLGHKQPLLLGVRERRGDERFGLTPCEIGMVAARLSGTPHRLVVYHTMVGSQLEDAEAWTGELLRSFQAYCRLRRDVPSLHMFDIGGGMPTSAYRLDFAFDYQGFLAGLFQGMAESCATHGVPHPDLVGELGRYTVASHSVYLMPVGAVKAGRSGVPAWYLLDGSPMVALPDLLIVPGQQFITLPLSHWDAPATEVRLGGRHTCDTDDCYPRVGQQPLILPAAGEGLVVAMFGVGAYQQALSGRGGAHHCLAPEPQRIVIEVQPGGELLMRAERTQPLSVTLTSLGYGHVTPQATMQPCCTRSQATGAPVSSQRPTHRTDARQLGGRRTCSKLIEAMPV